MAMHAAVVPRRGGVERGPRFAAELSALLDDKEDMLEMLSFVSFVVGSGVS